MTDQREQFDTMNLGDHLDELRKRLFYALIGLTLGIAISIGFGKPLLGVMFWPFNEAVDQFKVASSSQDETDTEKTFNLYAHAPAEKLTTFFKTTTLFGIIISSPWISYQFWAFISAGLYKKEKRFVYKIMPASVILFLLGTVFFILVIAPMMLLFFMKFDIGLTVSDQWRMRDYISFITTLTLVFGCAFQLPILIISLVKMGIATVATLGSYRKYVLLALFLAAAIITPPDVISQIALALPLYALYEGSLLICRIWK